MPRIEWYLLEPATSGVSELHTRGLVAKVADWRFADCGSQALSEKEDAEQKHNAAGRDQQGEEDITNVLKYS